MAAIIEPSIFCTAIIPTVGRPTLARAVESVLQQDLPEGAAIEVRVINDSGQPLPPADWQKDARVQVITTQRRERSVARNTGAAAARGRYLHFLDDDDWLAPEAYRRFYELSLHSPAKWLYGMTQLVDRRIEPTIQLRHNLHGNAFLPAMAGEWIPLQASLIERQAFMQVGGFNPLLAGPEDIDLQRRMLLVEDLDETPHVVAYVIRGEEGSTTNYALHAQRSRLAREWILDTPGVFRRMRASAGSPFWYGRMARIYLTSAAWNLRRRRLFTTLSRLLFAAASLLSAKAGLFSASFWQSLANPYASLTFERGLQEARKAEA